MANNRNEKLCVCVCSNLNVKHWTVLSLDCNRHSQAFWQLLCAAGREQSHDWMGGHMITKHPYVVKSCQWIKDRTNLSEQYSILWLQIFELNWIAEKGLKI